MTEGSRTFPDPSRQMAEAVSSIALSLETSTRLLSHIDTRQNVLSAVLDRLARAIGLAYVLVGIGLLTLGFLFWQGRELHAQTTIMHASTRAMVQSNQALLAELLKRHP